MHIQIHGTWPMDSLQIWKLNNLEHRTNNIFVQHNEWNVYMKFVSNIVFVLPHGLRKCTHRPFSMTVWQKDRIFLFLQSSGTEYSVMILTTIFTRKEKKLLKPECNINHVTRRLLTDIFRRSQSLKQVPMSPWKQVLS